MQCLMYILNNIHILNNDQLAIVHANLLSQPVEMLTSLSKQIFLERKLKLKVHCS